MFLRCVMCHKENEFFYTSLGRWMNNAKHFSNGIIELLANKHTKNISFFFTILHLKNIFFLFDCNFWSVRINILARQQNGFQRLARLKNIFKKIPPVYIRENGGGRDILDPGNCCFVQLHSCRCCRSNVKRRRSTATIICMEQNFVCNRERSSCTIWILLALLCTPATSNTKNNRKNDDDT